jgi:hypothetical protein
MTPITSLLSAACLLAAAAGTPLPVRTPDRPAAPAADPPFADPYVDVDEWRDAPVRHRYVHGGFKGTDTRFSFYLPQKEQYQGRFFQHVTPVPDDEHLAQKLPPGESNKIGFALASGAYFVETNGGGHLDLGRAAGAQTDSTITAYRANAASAQYSRTVAMRMYGGARPYGYAYGGSGGAYRTIGSIENTRGVWDGVVPYVVGSTMAIPNMFTVRIRAMRILEDVFPRIVDAVEPGGSGDPYAGLSAEQAAVLREVTRMGFPVPAWFGYRTMGIHGFAALYQGVVMADPGYFTDFWTTPGYLGFDHPEQFAGARLQHESTIAAPITAAEAARLRLDTDASRNEDRGGVDKAFLVPTGEEARRVVALRLAGPVPRVDFFGGDLIVRSGAAEGRRLPLARIVGDVVVLGIADSTVAALLAPGDRVQVDNSNFLAAETYHRHQVPGPEFAVWDQFRGPDGKPLYPQRPMLLGPLFVRATAGSLMTGQFDGRMIVVESLWDREAMPWQGDWYRSQVRKHLGEKTDDHFRLWYTDHALHGDDHGVEDPNRVVSYLGVLHQALRDLAAWVEKGVAPPPGTSYRIEDGQVIVPAGAAERRGVQPVVSLLANGSARAEVKVGEPVRFSGAIDLPPGTGSVVAAEWDLDGNGTFAARSEVPRGTQTANVSISHRYEKPGTYFVALRGTSQREGDRDTPYARIQNLGRVRVVVE